MTDKQVEPYIRHLQRELKLLIEHNESVLAYVRLLNAQVAGNTHRISDLQHKIAKERGMDMQGNKSD